VEEWRRNGILAPLDVDGHDGDHHEEMPPFEEKKQNVEGNRPLSSIKKTSNLIKKRVGVPSVR